MDVLVTLVILFSITISTHSLSSKLPSIMNANDIKEAIRTSAPFNEAELLRSVKTMKDLAGSGCSIDWDSYRNILVTHAHLSHKDWAITEQGATKLAKIFGSPDDPLFRKIFRRVLDDGYWDEAVSSAADNPSKKPWVVLISGLNGIRKTTSMYQPWFKQALNLALGNEYVESDLPSGADSFFRQLDFMVATVANEDFKSLYEIQTVNDYAVLKDAIFARNRCLAEMVGVLLIREAQKKKINVMLETSGRDIAMYDYVNTFFSDEDYRKLVVHFTINELSYAEESVDRRMLKEMKDGAKALQRGDTDPIDIVNANAGGPYGSAQLKSVQEASNQVWNKIEKGESIVNSWCKARLFINASNDQEWTCEVGNQSFAISRLEGK